MPGNWTMVSFSRWTILPPTLVQNRDWTSTSAALMWMCPMATPAALGAASWANAGVASSAVSAARTSRTGVFMAAYSIRDLHVHRNGRARLEHTSAACLAGPGELLQQRLCLLQRKTRVGDALTVHRRPPADVVLAALHEMALHHRAEDPVRPAGDLITERRRDIHLLEMVLVAVAVGAVHHH